MSAAPKIRDQARHGAKFSGSIIDAIQEVLSQFPAPNAPMLDPNGGIGSLARKLPFLPVITGDIEWPWVSQAPRPAVQLDFHHLPFPDASIGCVITSPDYGNRFADHHKPKDGSRRNSYAFWLREVGAEPHPNNGGLLHFGPAYKAHKIKGWREVRRVLVDDGWFILNVSDFIRNFGRVPVVDFHRRVCLQLGFELVWELNVPTPRMKDGANYDARVDGESVLVFRRPAR